MTDAHETCKLAVVTMRITVEQRQGRRALLAAGERLRGTGRVAAATLENKPVSCDTGRDGQHDGRQVLQSRSFRRRNAVMAFNEQPGFLVECDYLDRRQRV